MRKKLIKIQKTKQSKTKQKNKKQKVIILYNIGKWAKYQKKFKKKNGKTAFFFFFFFYRGSKSAAELSSRRGEFCEKYLFK